MASARGEAVRPADDVLGATDEADLDVEELLPDRDPARGDAGGVLMGEPIPPARVGQCCFQCDVGKPPSFPQRWHAYPALGSEANGPPILLLDDVVRVAGGGFPRASGGTLAAGGLLAAALYME